LNPPWLPQNEADVVFPAIAGAIALQFISSTAVSTLGIQIAKARDVLQVQLGTHECE
jgi:hypothetical protein